jgi:speckle-type POZ protein
MSSTTTGGGSGRKRSRSASAIVADTATGYHILRIDGYSRTKGIPTGECIKSRPFTVGGHRWHIDYHPNGHNRDTNDYISLFLVLDEAAPGFTAREVRAQQRFRFVGEVAAEEDGEESPPPALLAEEEVSNYGSHRGWGNGRFVTREELEKSAHLKNDSFAVRCDVVVINEFRAEDDETDAFVPVHPPDLRQHLGDLLRAGQGTDVMFEVGGEVFSAHRCVLAARSPVFDAEFFGAMKESQSGVVLVRIDDIDARVFNALLHFLYTDDLFRETNGEDAGEEEEDVMAQHLLVAADRYNLQRLKLMCEDKLCKYIDVGTVATILALAEQHHCHGLKKACFRFLSSPANLKVAVASDSFDHLCRSCPSAVKELIAMLGTLLE